MIQLQVNLDVLAPQQSDTFNSTCLAIFTSESRPTTKDKFVLFHNFNSDCEAYCAILHSNPCCEVALRLYVRFIR